MTPLARTAASGRRDGPKHAVRTAPGPPTPAGADCSRGCSSGAAPAAGRARMASCALIRLRRIRPHLVLSSLAILSALSSNQKPTLACVSNSSEDVAQRSASHCVKLSGWKYDAGHTVEEEIFE
jgi:hypothetical protein